MVKSKEAGNIKFIDGLKLITDHVQDNGLLAINPFAQTFLSAVTECLQDNAVIIIDKLSLLQSLGFTTKDLLNLTLALQNAQEEFKNCCLITRCRSLTDLGEAESHEDVDRFSAFLSHNSDLTIVVRPLLSGRSANVTGNLCYLWNDPEEKQIQRFQFRVEEKDVKVFARGTSNAVL